MEPPEDNFKWFGEGFEGFPKRLPQDCVEYFLFIIDKGIDAEAQTRAHLNLVLEAASQLTQRLLEGFIWQREKFELSFRDEAVYGDSVEDEWLVVYLLRELTKEFPALWARVVDTDGEFLLIEAANALPRWLNPEVAENRVWLHEEKLCLIPLTKSDATTPETPPKSTPLSLKAAHNLIKTDPNTLIRSSSIQEEAFYRLRNYPDQISQSLHHARVTIPRKLAFILREKPDLISPAVEAFYLRDPIALRPLQASISGNDGKLVFSPDDLVKVILKFTKVGYAQLKSQQFQTPPVWTSFISTNPTTPGSDPDPDLESGIKVTCGFEMLVNDPQNKGKPSVQTIHNLLKAVSTSSINLPSDATIAEWPQTPDSESWLDINFSDLERELSGHPSSTKNPAPNAAASASNPLPGDFNDKTAQENLRKIVSRFEDFLNDDTAGAEGAEFLDDDDIDDDSDYNPSTDSNSDSDSDDDDEGEDKDVSFNEAEFARMMREMMGLPPEVANNLPNPREASDHARITELDEGDEDAATASPTTSDEPDAEEIRSLTQRMEAELRASGALDLDPATPARVKGKGKGKQRAVRNGSAECIDGTQATGHVDEDEEEEGDEEAEADDDVDIDVNLARNLLESLKSQAGMAGPGGNLLGALGMKMPRDEGE
ncbi:MAG: hypothetical protein M1833_004218 [Piccolia ochrophora]|nr:MAG: hypothetical protein M1833_004218 [Piccolia ochrophora]